MQCSRSHIALPGSLRYAAPDALPKGVAVGLYSTLLQRSSHVAWEMSATTDMRKKSAVNTNFLRWICLAGIGRLRGEGVPAMTVLAYSLAADEQGMWRLVFVPDDLHLYVEFSRPNAEANPVDWLSVDDFLAWRPKARSKRMRSIAWLRSFAGR